VRKAGGDEADIALADQAGPKRRNAPSDVRRGEIIEAAASLFAERGFGRTTVRELAKALDLQSGTIFHYYTDKRSILVDVIREGTVRTAAAVDEHLTRASGPRDRLEGLVRSHIETLLGEARPYSLVALLEWNFLTPDEQEAIAPVRDAYERTWDRILEEAVAAGLLQPSPLLRLFLLGTCNSTLLWYKPAGDLPPSRIADRYVEIALGL
jgi:TetR/AcrR family transcriptional regulator, cholesterol catabolism regulator